MALPLKYNIRNIIVRKGSTLATAFTIGLTVAVFLMVMALARGIDMTLSSSGEPLNMIVLREGSTAELNSSVTRENFNDLMYLDGVEREADKPLAAGEAGHADLQSSQRNESGFECHSAWCWTNVVQVALGISNRCGTIVSARSDGSSCFQAHCGKISGARHRRQVPHSND